MQRITDFGAFVEIMPGTDGLLHVSEIANYRVKDVRDELKEGQQVLVKVINIDPTGKIRLRARRCCTPTRARRRRPGEPGEEAGAAAGAPREGGGGARAAARAAPWRRTRSSAAARPRAAAAMPRPRADDRE